MHSAVWAALREALAAERTVALVTVIEGEPLGRQIVLRGDGVRVGTLGSPERDREAERIAAGPLGGGRPVRARAGEGEGESELFVEAISPRPKLVCVGAVHVAIPLVHLASTLGYRTFVVDPREAFATAERFAHADELIPGWPREAFEQIGLTDTTSVAVLAHDPKIDIPALSLALESPARYVGALGSRRTHERRAKALREAGYTEEQIARVRSPIGLDLGGRRPEEIAVAIVAEMIAARHGKLATR